MAENEIQNAENEQQEAQQPVFQMQRCYLKDASLEMPNAPQHSDAAAAGTAAGGHSV